MEPCTFQSNLEREKIHTQKISYTSGNENLDKFLMFQEMETLKKLLIFQEVIKNQSLLN